mmetsp:Transcript_38896/g.39581  ORF Transcript_38896/g.39581 Transcript_38896/m.39581 type:complete len:80 (-) Transcript_38896:263-502(-)
MLLRQRAPPSFDSTHRRGRFVNAINSDSMTYNGNDLPFQSIPIPNNPTKEWKSWYKMELQILSSIVKGKLEEFQPALGS